VRQPTQSGRGPFASVAAFYPFYLSQHQVRLNRRMHFIGTTLLLLLVIASGVLGDAWLLIGLPLAGYGFAWAGHFFFEKNRPATFSHPLYSLICDFWMYWDIWRGRLSA
jgi:hypothetical protein